MVLVRPRIWPDTTETAPNSPMARALQRMTPYRRPQRALGRVIRQKVCQPLAPRDSAARSSSLPWDWSSGISSRATNGKVTKTVASTIPGTAKIILMFQALSRGPNQPRAPNSRTNTKPEVTGETENGRSIKEMRAVLPGKSNLAIVQEAARPNIKLAGTAIAATNRVSWIADWAAGFSRAAQ